MLNMPGDARAILAQYADTLSAKACAATQDEQDQASDDLIEITATIEAHGEEMAQLLRGLLSQNTGPAAE